MWAEKEMRNLIKMAKGGIRVPEVVILRKHVLLMSFIGQEGKPAPKLKDAADRMNKEELYLAYNQVKRMTQHHSLYSTDHSCFQIVEMMSTLYSTCHLVHADLSE